MSINPMQKRSEIWRVISSGRKSDDFLVPTLRTGAAFNRAFGGPGALSERIAL